MLINIKKNQPDILKLYSVWYFTDPYTEMEENLKNKENSELLEPQSSNDAQIQDQLDSDLILIDSVEKVTGIILRFYFNLRI